MNTFLTAFECPLCTHDAQRNEISVDVNLIEKVTHETADGIIMWWPKLWKDRLYDICRTTSLLALWDIMVAAKKNSNCLTNDGGVASPKAIT